MALPLDAGPWRGSRREKDAGMWSLSIAIALSLAVLAIAGALKLLVVYLTRD